MSIASILVHVDNSTACRTRLQTAARLSRQFDTHLIALYVIPRYSVPMYAEAHVGPEIIEATRRALWAAADEAKSSSEGIAGKMSVDLEWRAVEGHLVNTLNEHGRYSDLVVLGQPNLEDPEDRSEGVADHVALECGTPCLVVPYIGASENLTGTILVAWNGSMESARAVKDAIPLMKKARRVEVLMVNPEQNEIQAGDIPGADIGTYLARHDIKVEAHTIHNKQIETGDVVLSHAADISADLLVMGAYGHARWRERVLGGVTQHLLEHMTVAVLMSH